MPRNETATCVSCFVVVLRFLHLDLTRHFFLLDLATMEVQKILCLKKMLRVASVRVQ